MNTQHKTSAFLSIDEIANHIRAGQLTSEQMVMQYIERAQRLDKQLHAYIDVYSDEALNTARLRDQQAQRGKWLGALHGIPVAIKDLFDIQGKPTTGGSKAIPARHPQTDATVITRLKAAGAIILGKTHTVEYAFGGWGTNEAMGTPWNPWDMTTHRIPGGSSSGSAVAVSAGLAAAAIGSDTGGSVRIPAGLCNLVGLKPTAGLISRHGLIELCPTHDTVGPITRTVKDCALLLDIISGPDTLDPYTCQAPVRQLVNDLDMNPTGLRVWVLPDAERQYVDIDVLEIYDTALEKLQQLGMQLIDKPLPNSLADAMQLGGALMSAEGYAKLGGYFEQPNDLFDPHVKRRILLGRQTSVAHYLDLLKQRMFAISAMQAAMRDIDLCVFPTNAISAIPVNEVDELATPLSRLGRFVNLLNLCSLAVPAGFSKAGLPVSIQFIGSALQEPRILQAGHAYQQATTWHQQYPSGLDDTH